MLTVLALFMLAGARPVVFVLIVLVIAGARAALVVLARTLAGRALSARTRVARTYSCSCCWRPCSLVFVLPLIVLTRPCHDFSLGVLFPRAPISPSGLHSM